MSCWPTPGRAGREAWGQRGSWLGVRAYVRREAVGDSGAQLLKPAVVDWMAVTRVCGWWPCGGERGT